VGGVLAAALVLSTCAVPEPATVLVLDLAEELPAAELHRERSKIVPASREAREALTGDWSRAERAPDGTPFVWALGAEPGVRFFLTEIRDLHLRLRGRAAPNPRGRDRALDVRVGDALAARLAVQSGAHEYSLKIPARLLRAGENLLTLGQPWATPPRRLGLSADRRALGMAWEHLLLRPADDPARWPYAASGGSGEAAIILPFGSAVSFYFPAATGSRLSLAGLEAEGNAQGRLRVDVRLEGRQEHLAASLEPGQEPRQVALIEPGQGEALVALRLAAVATSPGRGGGLRLIRPEIRKAAPGEPGEPLPRVVQSNGASTARLERRLNVILYLVDTLRADRLGAYGATSGLTPNLDAFAAEAIVFEDVVAPAPWTRPSVATVMTGSPPLAHGVTTLENQLPAGVPVVAELLGAVGYRTAAFSANSHVSPNTGFARGFDEFDLDTGLPGADVLGERALAWLDEHRRRFGADTPFFVYLHAIDPHAPYDPPASFRRRFAREAAPGDGTLEHLKRIYSVSGARRRAEMATIPPLYDAEVAFADVSFGTFLEGIAARGLLEETVIVLTADHGEELGEHGHLGHGQNLHGETLHVPWMLRLPSGSPLGGPRRVEATAGLEDLLPTLLARLRLALPPEATGRDLLAAATSATSGPVFSHLDYDGRRGIGVTLGEWKAIEPLSRAFGSRPLLFHRSRDPEERTDLSSEHPVRFGYLRTLARKHLAAYGGGGPDHEEPALDQETRRGLAALGYL